METDRNVPELQILKKSVEQVLEKECIFTTVCGATDARFFAKNGLPVVIMNPDCADEHGPGEAVRLESLVQLEQILLQAIQKISGQD